MKWFGPAKHVDVIEQGDLLLIKATGVKCAVDLLLPLFACGWTYAVWRGQHLVLFFFGLFFIGSTIWRLFQDEDGELRITDFDIIASGDLGGWKERSVQFRWADISGLDYRQGGEDEVGGLYAKTGRWNATCVMAGLSKEQSEEVIAAVYRRFPYVVMAEEKSDWSLFGSGSELINLGLSKPKK
jgi:hypothetical protein